MRNICARRQTCQNGPDVDRKLHQHRGRGQQQSVVKHVTVNADQAVVADQVVTGEPAGDAAPSPALLTCTPEAHPEPRRGKPS